MRRPGFCDVGVLSSCLSHVSIVTDRIGPALDCDTHRYPRSLLQPKGIVSSTKYAQLGSKQRETDRYQR